MRKKSLVMLLVLLACSLLLIFSYSQWKHKINSHQQTSSIEAKDDNKGTKNRVKQKPKNENSHQSTAEEEEDAEKLEKLIANQDQALQELFLQRVNDGKKVNVLLIGSNELEYGSPGVAERLDNALNKYYGDFIETHTTLQETNIVDFNLNEFQNEVNLDDDYDVLIIEPFTLRNNGVVSIEEEHEHLQAIIQKLNNQVDDALVVIHASQPIYQATNYPARVEALEDFAKEQNYIYLNYWEEWPSSTSEELLQYVDEDNHVNDEGAELWANYLTNYFIAEKMEEAE